MVKDVSKILRSTSIALKGLRHAYRLDKSFRMEVRYGLPIYLALGWYLFPLEPWELLFFALSYFLILIVELVNTAFEKMLDRVHPEQHELIGKSKDMASAAMFMAFVFAAVVICTLLYVRCTQRVDLPLFHSNLVVTHYATDLT